MSTVYTGNPANNPASITVPSDGDARSAASVNPAFEGLADQVAWTQATLATETANRVVVEKETATMPSLNFTAAVSVGTTNKALAYSEIEQAWYVIQAASTSAFRSADFGKTYGAVTLASASAAWDIAFDTSGNAVICGGANVQEAAFVAYGTALVWNNHAAVVTAYTNRSTVAFEPVSGLWCIIGAVTSTSANAWTSSNRSTWSASTLPATWSTLPTVGNITLGVGNGLLVASYVDSASTFRTMRSSNGGVSWTNDQAITVNAGITLSTGSQSRPVWSAADGLWYLCVNQTGTRKSQVFSSPDAITWTSVATLLSNDCAFEQIVVIDMCLTAFNDDGRVFVSTNKGVTWYRAGVTVASLFNAPKTGGGGIAALTVSSVAASQRFGALTQVA